VGIHILKTVLKLFFCREDYVDPEYGMEFFLFCFQLKPDPCSAAVGNLFLALPSRNSLLLLKEKPF
jgi:hypothetical protein